MCLVGEEGCDKSQKRREDEHDEEASGEEVKQGGRRKERRKKLLLFFIKIIIISSAGRWWGAGRAGAGVKFSTHGFSTEFGGKYIQEYIRKFFLSLSSR